MKIENREKEQYLKLTFKYEFDEYITYTISGKNHHFSGISNFCFNKKIFNEFINHLIHLTPWNSVKIQDNDSDGFICIEKIDTLWHYTINYQIWWSHQDNYCKLILNTDFNGITNFVNLIKEDENTTLDS